jgi:hypothetical protein
MQPARRTRRIPLATLLLAGLSVLAFAVPFLSDARADSLPPSVLTVAAKSCIPADKCCKICDEGKACGNSCISRSKNCHKGRGCACNAAEVCE